MNSKDLKNIINPIKNDFVEFNDRFKSMLDSKVDLINTVINYLLRNKGKQLRPIICLLSSKICGDINEKSYISASLIEMLHVATLIHDDVVDESDIRRYWPTVSRIWNNKLSVLVGDYIFSRALTNMVKLNSNDALKILSDTAERLSQGEILQIERAIKRNMTEEVYYTMIKDKTASLFSATCSIGAISATSAKDKIEALKMYGEFLGMAFQIKDDLFDVLGSVDKTGKPIGFDIKKNMLTLPYIHILDKLNHSKKKKFLSEINSCAKKNDFTLLRSLINDNGGIIYAERKMEEFSNIAVRQLDVFKDSDIKKSLIAITKYNLDRTR